MTRTAYRSTTSGLILSALLAFAGIQPARAQTKDFNVTAQSATTGIPEFARQAGIQILVSEPLVRGKRIAAVTGLHSVDDALAILLKGTGLVATSKDGATYTVAAEAPAPISRNSTGAAGALAASPASAQDVPAGESSSTPSQTEKAKVFLEEVVVTGSRIPLTATEGSQDVKVYAREQIDQSGQTTVADFLNTLPDVSISTNENAFQTFEGSTTVQLHGLPLGTTLLLINGRRVQTSGGTFGTFFDLNNIPLVAVDRIEVVSEGSSAIYGSDAIAGVVNVILRKSFDGFEASGKYSFANGIPEWDSGLAWGAHWDKGSLSIVSSFQNRGELDGSGRAPTRNQDYRAFGGIDARSRNCNPGNVYTVDGSNLPGVGAPFAGVPAGFTGTPTQQEFAKTAGVLNRCSLNSYSTMIPSTQRQGVFAEGTYAPKSSIELFSETMFSHERQSVEGSPPNLFGFPGFQSYTASAANPYNPFHETVGVSYLLSGLGRSGQPIDTTFFRPLIGGRGMLFSTWKWEVSAWDSFDESHYSITNNLDSTAVQNALNSSDAATALNPFGAGSPGSPQLLQSLVGPDQTIHFYGQTLAANGFVRGPLFHLPSGSVDLVLGSEYNRDRLDINYLYAPAFEPPNTVSDHSRAAYAIFGETRIPLFATRRNPPAGDVLAVTIAGRYDHYSDFGSKATPQFGAEWRPTEGLLFRGTYSGAFRAPDLYYLYLPVVSFQSEVVDPLRGNQLETVTELVGGNTHLKPETGLSRTLGFVYSSKAIRGLQVSVTHWGVAESNSIQSLPLQVLVDDENLFPGSVTRNAAGVITQVSATYLNFGNIDVAGFDYQLSYRLVTGFGELSPLLAATQTYRYRAALTPSTAAVDATSNAQDSGNWAPRWKGIASLSWKLDRYSAYVAGRYVGRYADYDTTREIGNFWLFDANCRYALGQLLASNSKWARGAYIGLGGVNLFNRLPQYSKYFFGTVGYDPAQADIRGRFIYAQLGVRW